uniref:contractile injection system tape measure protein n=1 Tax=Serratia proteamaculans TaxID=28151 RepID=UPI001F4BD608|nr:contractile injection system tape measure protein [Serratia proteamaculans]ULG16489.1 hypothetical protein 1137p_00091 [Serratia proteamaculans]
MKNINIDKVLCNIGCSSKKIGEEVLSSSLLTAEKIKEALRLASQGIVISGEISVDKWVIDLGGIPEAQFDTLFIPRLVQAFAGRLACEQASIVGQHPVKMLSSNVAESSVLLNGPHLDGEGLFQLARCCLTPQPFKKLLQDSPTYQLQQSLKLVLEGAWQSPKMVPAIWYDRVTASRLSIAAVLYLLKHQQGHNWLTDQYSPTPRQITDWAKAIAQGEIPPEQVVQLLSGDSPPNCTSHEQRAYSPLLVMRWLLPLWQQPAVRQVVRRQEGRGGVQQIDAYLSCCLQRQDNHTVLEGKARDTAPLQIALSRDNATLREGKELPTAAQARERYLQFPNDTFSSSQCVSNAGLLLLWPLLPQLFSQLTLWADIQFVSDTTRWQAVHCLNRLVWGEANPTEECLTLNQVLCGVSLLTPVPPTVSLSVLQQQQIDDWLTAIGQQLVGWQKLSLADIRQLFLQRAGEISMEGGVPQISVHPEPYDFLLRDWPWPMTLASFPWTEQPLTIVWTLNGFTG